MDTLVLYYIGIFIVFSSHIYMLVNPNTNQFVSRIHAISNLVAASLIAYWFVSTKAYKTK